MHMFQPIGSSRPLKPKDLERDGLYGEFLFVVAVETGHMVDTCTETWLTLPGSPLCQDFRHALEREKRH
ncbi:hypothetical protein, partial [Pseudomonas sp. 1]|uniref:hypothetical protein n=1 Tax=Pseudomonas sp. 1 TaxID=488747 RepID=UPI00209B6274